MVNVKKILEIEFEDGDCCYEFEDGDYVHFIMKDGTSACGDIIEIKENSVIINEDVTCEEGEEIPFDEIVGVL